MLNKNEAGLKRRAGEELNKRERPIFASVSDLCLHPMM